MRTNKAKTENRFVKFVKENKKGIVVGVISTAVVTGIGLLIGKNVVTHGRGGREVIKFLTEVDRAAGDSSKYIAVGSDAVAEVFGDEDLTLVLGNDKTYKIAGMVLFGDEIET